MSKRFVGWVISDRFIPDTITDHFEQCAWPPAAREVGPRPKAPTKLVDIAAPGLKAGGGDCEK